MKNFISCDWGTSSLRMKLVDGSNKAILAGLRTDEGIATTYQLWKQSGANDEKRSSFYRSVIANKIKEIEKQSGLPVAGTVIIISGMASSSIGMMELPYGNLPFLVDGSGLMVKRIPADHEFNFETILIPGIKSGDDVMRGEETELAGCGTVSSEESVFIFPGTHSKHVVVRQGKAVDFKTYMTGEFFRLLTTNSILSNSVEKHEGFFLMAFNEGVMDSLSSNLLHKCFTVRTNELFSKFSRQENYDYLSGLLIGTELKELLTLQKPMTLVCSESVRKYYITALETLNMDKVEFEDAERAVTMGHFKIYDLYTKGATIE